MSSIRKLLTQEAASTYQAFRDPVIWFTLILLSSVLGYIVKNQVSEAEITAEEAALFASVFELMIIGLVTMLVLWVTKEFGYFLKRRSR